MNQPLTFDGLCRQCGTPNDPQRKFCYQCACPLRYACSLCGWQNSVSQARCQQCQTDQSQQSTVPAADELPQSRPVTAATTKTPGADRTPPRESRQVPMSQPAASEVRQPIIRGNGPIAQELLPGPKGNRWPVVTKGLLLGVGLVTLGLALAGSLAISRFLPGRTRTATSATDGLSPKPPVATVDSITRQPAGPSLPTTVNSDSMRPRLSPTVVPDVENSVGMQFIWCPPGQFLMGSPQTEPGHQPDEQQHEVTLTSGFYLSRYLVSVQQASLTTGLQPSRSMLKNEPRYLERAQVFSTWNDAIIFCRQLTSLPEERSAGRIYRLPTEAEWEYACRAGTTTAFYFGDDSERRVAFAHVGESPWSQPLGLKVANPWGFFDMAGGIGEWCQDWYEPLPAAAQIDPRGPSQGDRKVIRGRPRSAQRQTSSGANLRDAGTGLRLVVEIPSADQTSR